MTEDTAAAAGGPAPEPMTDAAGRGVLVRLMRASSRVRLSPPHVEALFGAGTHLTPVWGGILEEPLCLERVGVSGKARRELKVRVVHGTDGATLVSLTQAAITQLDLLQVPAHGMPSRVGTALTGPKGAVVLDGGVTRAAPRLLLPPSVARQLGLEPGARVGGAFPSTGAALEEPALLECPPTLREAVLVLDAQAADGLGEPGAAVLVRLQRA